MEGDFVYVIIERLIKYLDMFFLSDWMVGVCNVKVNLFRYVVKEIGNRDVLNFKEFIDDCIGNRNCVEDGLIMKWNNIYLF